MQTLATLFEKLAERTWTDIEDGKNLKITQGEETITDRNLLDIKREGNSSIVLIKTLKHEEAIRGIDWEWWIGSSYHGWLRYAIQAKRISSKNETYNTLHHLVKRVPQINLLREYAKTNFAIPLYCFYNFLDEPDLRNYWQCKLLYDKKQLGCTLTPLRVVQNALNKNGERNFYSIHRKHETIPWRCLSKCPGILKTYETGSSSFRFENLTIYPNLPDVIKTVLGITDRKEYSLKNVERKTFVLDDLDTPHLQKTYRRIEFEEWGRPMFILPKRLILFELSKQEIDTPYTEQ